MSQINRQCEEWYDPSEDSRNSRKTFVQDIIFTNVRIRQKHSQRFSQVQALGDPITWEDFVVWLEDLWLTWMRFKCKGLVKKGKRRANAGTTPGKAPNVFILLRLCFLKTEKTVPSKSKSRNIHHSHPMCKSRRYYIAVGSYSTSISSVYGIKKNC
jgi:hypothetical protein